MNELVGVLVGIWCLGGLVGYYTARGTSKRRCVRPIRLQSSGVIVS